MCVGQAFTAAPRLAATIGGYTDLAFAIPHGCEDSPTTKVEFTIPAEFERVTPNVNPNWEVQVSGGGKPSKVTYTAKTPLPSDLRDTLVLSVKVAEDAKPEAVLVPTLQSCAQGSVAWTSENQEDKTPAPMVTLVASDSEDHGSDAGHSHSHGDSEHSHGDSHGEDATAPEQVAASSSDSGSLSAWALGLGILGSLLGAIALVVNLRK